MWPINFHPRMLCVKDFILFALQLHANPQHMQTDCDVCYTLCLGIVIPRYWMCNLMFFNYLVDLHCITEDVQSILQYCVNFSLWYHTEKRRGEERRGEEKRREEKRREEKRREEKRREEKRREEKRREEKRREEREEFYLKVQILYWFSSILTCTTKVMSHILIINILLWIL